jgi:WhiB family redox-sensing transcriptional regulator
VDRRQSVPTQTTPREPYVPPGGDWRALGACAGSELELFYADEADDGFAELTRAAKAICARCVVREACLESALRDRERLGVWGGMTARERSRLLRRLRRAA